MDQPLSLASLLEVHNMSAAGLAARIEAATGREVSARMAQRWAARTTRMDAGDIDAVVRTLGLAAADTRRFLAWAAERTADGEGA